MSSTHYLGQIVTLMGTAVAVSWLFRLIRLPSILGFLITGMAIGPSGWQLIPQEAVGQFAEIGLILLLFTVGLELSPEPLIKSGQRLITATGLQVIVTLTATLIILYAITPLTLTAMAVIGLGVALSSTAIVLKQMSDRGETNSTTGLITTGILLLQDVLVIAVLLAVSMMSNASGDANWHSVAIRGLAGLIGLTLCLLVARRALPFVLTQIARHGGRELITLCAVLAACGGAWLAEIVGWSPALGACIAGLLLAGADERHQLVAEITPFRDVFNALFFISLGMSAQLSVAFEHTSVIVIAIAVTLLLKTVLTAISVKIAGWPIRIGLQVGITLCTVSEFSYVLVQQASRANIVPPEVLDIMIVYAIGTMMVGTLLYPLATPLALMASRRMKTGSTTIQSEAADPGNGHYSDHVIIVGYGVTGSNLAKMLTATHVPHCVVEMNQGLVKKARQAGELVIVGDATRIAILEHAGIDTARVFVVAINDKMATQRIVAQVSARRADLYILARTPFAADIEALAQRGATLVIPEDFETSIEVAAHVLKTYGIPDNIVEAQVASVRAGGYAMLRGMPTTRASHAELIRILDRTTTQTFYIGEDSYPCGRTIAEINLRKLTGCMIIAAVRSGKPTTNPAGDFVVNANDVLVLVGAHAQIEAAKALLKRSKAEGPPPITDPAHQPN